MRYLMGLAAGCAVGLWLAGSAALAGPREDCANAKDPDLAIKACSQLIRRNPRDTAAYGGRGIAHANKGDYDRAIADLDEAIRLNPRDGRAYSSRGTVYSEKGAYDRAVTDFNEAIRLNPKDVPALSNRGFTYILKGDYDRAVTDLNEAIRLNPRDAISYTNRGKAYRGKGEYERALADHNKAVKLDPSVSLSYLYRGETYEAKGDHDKAIDDYKKALSLAAESKWESDRQEEARQRLAALQAALLAPAPAPAEMAPAAPKAPRPDGPPAAAPAPAPTAVAPPPAAPPAATAVLGRRVALVIGNAGYKVGPLQNPGNDATAVAEALEKQLKFDKVILKLNLGSEGFRAALREFSREAAGAGLALVYFAGHGTEVGGRNFLIPVDAALARAGDLDLEAIALDIVLAQLAGVRTLKLVILDACRNNLFPLAGAQRSGSRGLVRIEPEENTLVVYAAKDGTTADDGAGRRHSPFTEALLKHIATPSLEINYLFREVRDEVVAATGKAQQPHVYGTLGRTKIYLRQSGMRHPARWLPAWQHGPIAYVRPALMCEPPRLVFKARQQDWRAPPPAACPAPP